MLNLTEVYVSRTLRKLRVYIWIPATVTHQHMHANTPDKEEKTMSKVLEATPFFITCSYPAFHVELFPHVSDHVKLD